jgi:hypothetical protein
MEPVQLEIVVNDPAGNAAVFTLSFVEYTGDGYTVDDVFEVENRGRGEYLISQQTYEIEGSGTLYEEVTSQPTILRPSYYLQVVDPLGRSAEVSWLELCERSSKSSGATTISFDGRPFSLTVAARPRP